ncbi:iron response transcriptional regulator IrrA [Pinisolibacter sp.]|uniref:iron response transcriptional regulator IrrA n=1 Tax=Pinisolibacter sp. TaxID=2172024 RepID=UPI002FDDAD57
MYGETTETFPRPTSAPQFAHDPHVRADVVETLRRAGLRPTRQRTALAALLFGGPDRHVSAETIYEEAMTARVSVSLATVYNTLHQFTEAGLLRELAVSGAKSFFDTRTSPHHHFWNEADGEMTDVSVDAVDVTRLPEPPEGMEIAGVEVMIRLRPRRDRSGTATTNGRDEVVAAAETGPM